MRLPEYKKGLPKEALNKIGCRLVYLESDLLPCSSGVAFTEKL